MTYAKVHIINAPYHIDKAYTYHLPMELERKVRKGSVVVVPFGGGNKQKLGLVTELCDNSDCKTTKPVLGVPGKYLFIDEELLELCRFMKEHLFCSLGDAASCVIPSGLGVKNTRVYFRNKDCDEKDKGLNHASLSVLAELERCKEMSEGELKSTFGAGAVACARALEKMGLLSSYDDFECKVNTKSEKYVVLSDDEDIVLGISDGSIKLSPKQMNVFEALLRYESPCPVTELCEISGAGVSVINELSKKGIY